MTLPVRWSPAREMMSMRQMMDHLMESAFVPAERWAQSEDGFSARMDFSETSEAYEVKLSIPGVDPDDINITLENNTLTVRGEMQVDSDQDDAEYHTREIRYGTFSRSLMLPSNVDANAIEAECGNGILRLHLPKTEEARSRRIQVRGTGSGKGSPTIEGAAISDGQGGSSTDATSQRSSRSPKKT